MNTAPPTCRSCGYPASSLNEAGYCAYCCGPNIVNDESLVYDDRMKVFIYMFNDLVHAVRGLRSPVFKMQKLSKEEEEAMRATLIKDCNG